jgi:hypothetical protein
VVQLIVAHLFYSELIPTRTDTLVTPLSSRPICEGTRYSGYDCSASHRHRMNFTNKVAHGSRRHGTGMLPAQPNRYLEYLRSRDRCTASMINMEPATPERTNTSWNSMGKASTPGVNLCVALAENSNIKP